MLQATSYQALVRNTQLLASRNVPSGDDDESIVRHYRNNSQGAFWVVIVHIRLCSNQIRITGMVEISSELESVLSQLDAHSVVTKVKSKPDRKEYNQHHCEICYPLNLRQGGMHQLLSGGCSKGTHQNKQSNNNPRFHRWP